MLIAITVVSLIRVAGIILVLGMLTAPAAAASFFSKNLKNCMLIAIGFGIFFCVAGLFYSYEFNMYSGACIVILSVVCYFILYILNRIKMKKDSKTDKHIKKA